ncbi:MAG: DUF5985 family protein [Oligoflexales bacterium]
MTTSTVFSDFFSGISTSTFAASGLFFLKFWFASRDRFFLQFSAACWCLAIERLVLVVVTHSHITPDTPVVEASSWVYLLRLSAFVLISWAIIDKNRKNESVQR